MYPQCFSQQILKEKLWDAHCLCKNSILPAYHISQEVHQLLGKAFPFCVHWSIMNAFSTELPCNSLILIQKTFLPKYSDSCLHAKSLQLYPTLCGPMDCSQPRFSVQGLLQVRIEWVAVPSSRGSSWPRNRTQVGSFPLAPPGKPSLTYRGAWMPASGGGIGE